MMAPRSRFPWAAQASLLSALLLASAVYAQLGSAPFVDRGELVGETLGYEMAVIRLQGMAAAVTEDGAEVDDLVEEAEALVARDLPRFFGTLDERDPELAAEIAARFEDLGRAVTVGDVAALPPAIEEALRVLDLAGTVLDNEELLADPAFSAALMALLLLANEGVAERYEEAVAGELAVYPGGWYALARVERLWGDLIPLASDHQRFEVEDMLDQLDALYPQAELDDDTVLIDAEAAEDPAQRLVGFLEEIADAELYPDRNLGNVIVLTRGLVAQACQAFEAGDEARARQSLTVAGFYYAQYVGGTLALLAPEVHQGLEPLWRTFSEENAAAADEVESGIDCPILLERLGEAGALFGV